jgi:hypothetical protein
MSLEDRLSRDPEPWRPKPGDRLVGEILSIEQRDGDYEPYPLLSILADDGVEWNFHAFHTVAKRELAKQRPAVGDRIGVRYAGKRDGANGEYDHYRILVERAEPAPTAAPDWDQIAADADAELDDSAPAPGLNEPQPATPDLPDTYVSADGRVS